MMKFSIVDADGDAVVTYHSESFSRDTARSPTLARWLMARMTNDGYEVTPHYEKLFAGFADYASTGAQFTDCVVSADGGDETLVFTLKY